MRFDFEMTYCIRCVIDIIQVGTMHKQPQAYLKYTEHTLKQVVKVIWHKAASPPQIDVQSYLPGGATLPSHEGTLAPPGKYDWTCASFGPPSPQPKRQIDWFSRCHTAHGRVSSDTMAPPGKYDWICASFRSPMPTTQAISRSVQLFLHSLLKKVPVLGRPFPQNYPFPQGPIRAHNPNGISIGSAVFAQMTAGAGCPCWL